MAFIHLFKMLSMCQKWFWVLGPQPWTRQTVTLSCCCLLSVRESQDTWTKYTVNFLTVAKEKIKKRREQGVAMGCLLAYRAASKDFTKEVTFQPDLKEGWVWAILGRGLWKRNFTEMKWNCAWNNPGSQPRRLAACRRFRGPGSRGQGRRAPNRRSLWPLERLQISLCVSGEAQRSSLT